MKRTQLIMGMPITVEIVSAASAAAIERVFAHFRQVDNQFSTYKPTSEISRINAGLPESQWSATMRRVLALCDETKRLSDGYFDIEHEGRRDPSGLVKGWAIQQAAERLHQQGFTDFYIEAGGDVQAHGSSAEGDGWTVGIRNPFQLDQIVKVLRITGAGVATSGAYIRGEHIYNPRDRDQPPHGIASLTVVGGSIYDADRFATAAYAMGVQGIHFIEARTGLEGYMIDTKGTATMTTGFERYVVHA